MTNTNNNNNNNNNSGSKAKSPRGDTTAFQLCIGFEMPPPRDPDDSVKPISFECLRRPGDRTSPKYTLKVYPFEDGDTCETYILTRQNLAAIVKGQGITTTDGRISLIRQLFRGEALTAFDNEIPADGNDVTDLRLEPARASTVFSSHLLLKLSYLLDLCIRVCYLHKNNRG